MAVSTAYSVLAYSGNGSTTAFSVTWPFFEDNDLVVTLIDSTGVETVKTLTTHYTVSGGTDSDGLPATGTVTMLTAPASGETLRIQRQTDKTQASTWSKNGPFSAKTLEAALDKVILLVQEVAAGGSDALDGITGDVMRLVSSGATDYWDGESQLIRNVANAVGSTDAVPYGQLLTLVAATPPELVSSATGDVTVSTPGEHIVMANAATATVTIASGVDWCMVSRSSQSAADVTVVSADGPSVTIEEDGTGVVINAQLGPVLFIVDPADNTNYITVTPQIETWGTSTPLINKTVAELASITPTRGATYFATDGRKGGEGSGAGTGIPVFGDNVAWRTFDTGATVAS